MMNGKVYFLARSHMRPVTEHSTAVGHLTSRMDEQMSAHHCLSMQQVSCPTLAHAEQLYMFGHEQTAKTKEKVHAASWAIPIRWRHVR